MKILRSLSGLVLVLTLFLSHTSMAQKKAGKAKPSWVTMMDDPNVNYFNAVEAFETYWKNRERPVVENEMFESVEDKKKEQEIRERKKKTSGNDPAQLYVFEYKRFLWWKTQVEPFVQSDGRIRNMDERINEWAAQQKQKKEQQGKEKSDKKN